MRLRLMLIMAIAFFGFACVSHAQAASPSFGLSFRFDPPFNVTTMAVPAFYLDICDAPDCSSVKRSLMMNCSTQLAPPHNGLTIIGCMVHAVSHLGFPDAGAALLSQPANLRIRTNNLISQIFPFAGGQPVIPETFYNFVITPAATGFSVTPG